MPGAATLATALMPPPPTNASSSSSTAIPSGTTTTPGADAGIGSLSNAPTGSLGSTLEGLRTLVHKRKTAWTYLKNAADGRVYWFNASRFRSTLRLVQSPLIPTGCACRLSS